MKILLVVDVQNDFVSGVLGTEEARSKIFNIVNKIKLRESEGYKIIFTRDSHCFNYLSTFEGGKLPVEHCIINTEGWQIVPEVEEAAKNASVINKNNFGFIRLREGIQNIIGYNNNIEEIEIIGFCTDICVITNALILRTDCSTIEISVDPKCCAGTNEEKHLAALQIMESCMINIEE